MAGQKWGKAREGFDTGPIIDGHAEPAPIEGVQVTLNNGETYFVPYVSNQKTAAELVLGAIGDFSLGYTATGGKLTKENIGNYSNFRGSVLKYRDPYQD